MTLKSGLEVTQKIIQTGTIQKFGCGFLFAFHSNYGSVSHQFRDQATHWSKIVTFSYPIAFDAPVQEVAVGILPSSLVRKKTRMVGLPDGEKTLRICVIV